MKEIKIGHFTGEIKNGSKTMIEIDLQSDGNYSLLVMGKKLSLKISVYKVITLSIFSQ